MQISLLTSADHLAWADLLAALRETAVCLRLPYTRSPYFLTAKALNDETPASLFDFAQWDCNGGDVL